MHSNCTACSTVLHSSNRNSLERNNLPSCGSDKAMNSILSIAFVAKLCFLLFVGTNAFLQTFITTTSSLKPDWTKQGRNGAHDYCNTNAISYTALNENMRNNQVIGKKSLSRKAADVPQRMIHLLERMISTRKFVGSLEFRYDDAQIEEKIRQYKINVSIPDKASGLLLLRIAIAVGRRDVCKTLLRHGASQLAMDERGPVFYEALMSDKAGSLHMITDLLEGITPNEIKQILMEKSPNLSRASKKYWLERGLKHVFPVGKLSELGLSRLNALKYKIVGQSFALEQILGEVASHNVNTELSDKPLVLLFSGPPGHGKTEMAKQLAELLVCPFHKVDCRNHANPWEMFGSGVGYVGSDSGTQLSNFISDNAGLPSVVLLDEFDHCDPETWEAFYHIFDEGVFTQKKITEKGGAGGATRQLKCSRTLWLLTTNRFDDDINIYNDKHINSINAYIDGKMPFNDIYESFDSYIRPKLRTFFKGGLTRRIDAVVPFFKFNKEEAYVVADMYIDSVREMYSQPRTLGRKIGNLDFAVTDHAVGEVSKGYAQHQLDGASAVKRDINKKMIKNIHMQWMRSEGVFSPSSMIINTVSNSNSNSDDELNQNNDNSASSNNDLNFNKNNRDDTTWIHYTELDGFHQIGFLTSEQRSQKPYFTVSSRDSNDNAQDYDNRKNRKRGTESGKDEGKEEFDTNNKEMNNRKEDFVMKEGERSMGLIMRNGEWVVEKENNFNDYNNGYGDNGLNRKVIFVQDEMDLEWGNVNEFEEEEEREEEGREKETREEKEDVRDVDREVVRNRIQGQDNNHFSIGTISSSLSSSRPIIKTKNDNDDKYYNSSNSNNYIRDTNNNNDNINNNNQNDDNHDYNNDISNNDNKYSDEIYKTERNDINFDAIHIGGKEISIEIQEKNHFNVHDNANNHNIEDNDKNNEYKIKDKYDHIDLFFDGSKNGIFFQNFFSHHKINNSQSISGIVDLLCESLKPKLNIENIQVWVRNKGLPGDQYGFGILSDLDDNTNTNSKPLFSTFSSSSSSPPYSSFSSFISTDMESIDEEFERTVRGTGGGIDKNEKSQIQGHGQGQGQGMIKAQEMSQRDRNIEAMNSNNNINDNNNENITTYNPFGTAGRMLTMDQTDVVNGWRYLRSNMLLSSLKDLSSLPSSSSPSSTSSLSSSSSSSFSSSYSSSSSLINNFPSSNKEKERREEGETLDLYLELKDMATSLWPSDLTLKQWRMDLKVGDIIDVVFTESIPSSSSLSSSSSSSPSFSSSPPYSDTPGSGSVLTPNIDSGPVLEFEKELESGRGTGTGVRSEMDLFDAEKQNIWVEGKIIKIGEKNYGYRDSQLIVELLIGGTEEYLKSQNNMPSKEKFGNSNYIYPCHVQNYKILGQYSISSLSIQPLYSHSINWRKNTGIGSKVYALIKKGSWMAATIISIDDDDSDILFLRFDDDNNNENDEGEDDEKERIKNNSKALNDIVDKVNVDVDVGLDDYFKITKTARLPSKESAPMFKSVNRYSEELALFEAKEIGTK